MGIFLFSLQASKDTNHVVSYYQYPRELTILIETFRKSLSKELIIAMEPFKIVVKRLMIPIETFKKLR